MSWLLGIVSSGCARRQAEPDGSCLVQLENEIAQVRDEVLCRIGPSPHYVTNICRRIAGVADFQTRSRLFNQLQDAAFSVDLSQLGDVRVGDEAARDKTVWRLGRAYNFLDNLAHEITMSRMFSGDPPREQFEPLFRCYLKMREESRRRGRPVGGCPEKIIVIENMYEISLKMRMYATNDYAWVRERFRELSGHEMRTYEQRCAEGR